MIDVAMLEALAEPISGPGARLPPVDLEDVFAKVVADGWAPRNPAFGPELDRLEVSTVRGTCLNPILVAGDEVFVDPIMPPQPGDLVSFALSERGAAAQNSHLPTGKGPCRAGDFWIKLYIPYRGFADMLLENTGNSATATLLSCESPVDRPNLRPVRQVRRNGRLLISPDAFAGQLGAEAATDVASVFTAGPTTYSENGSGIITITPGALPTITLPQPIDNEYVAIITVYCEIVSSSAPFSGTTGFRVQVTQGLVGTVSPSYHGNGGTRTPFTIQYQTTVDNTAPVVVTLQAELGLSTSVVFYNVQMQAEFIKR